MAQASVISTWETFDIVDGGSGFGALKSHMNGNYVSARKDQTNTPLQAVATSIQAWEQFKFVQQPNGFYALQSNANGNYVSAGIGSEAMAGEVLPVVRSRGPGQERRIGLAHLRATSTLDGRPSGTPRFLCIPDHLRPEGVRRAALANGMASAATI